MGIGTWLNYYGQIILSLALSGSIGGLTTEVQLALAIGLLAFVIAICALGLVVMKRKQQ
jgi:hypothetical protein